MRSITARRICQIFFALLFMWLCVVTTVGEAWWQLRGWPVNWLLQLDPLVGLATLLATHTIYAGLLWGLATAVLTIVLGRVFCGWVCPWGTLQQALGWWSRHRLKRSVRRERNRYHRLQIFKYWLLCFLLAAAAADLWQFATDARNKLFWVLLGLVLAAGAARIAWLRSRAPIRAVGGVAALLILGAVLNGLLPEAYWLTASVQTGLLDPIPLLQRTVNLVLLPILDAPVGRLAVVPRVYSGAGLIGVMGLALLLVSLRIPRFYCRFVCPLGALLGLLGRWALWRVGKSGDHCRDCRRCETDCQGACAPTTVIRTHECLLCLNCLPACRHGSMGFGRHSSAAGEHPTPDLTRRQVLGALLAGTVAIPVLRLEGGTTENWNPDVIRPPGALAEVDFLTRCIKCGQCMRICPTNVIHPAGLQAGLEGLWTPVLNFRSGSGGCQPNCMACSHICPTAAIRPLTTAERLGLEEHAATGPLRIGTAFVDRGRCLPWAMDTPCIVCQENCPLSPKAIFTRVHLQVLDFGSLQVQSTADNRIALARAALTAGRLAGGDHFCRPLGAADTDLNRITANTADTLTLAGGPNPWSPPRAGTRLEIVIRLQQPYVDPRRCIGCGICEHECPVQGRRAIRVSAENESRNPAHRLLVG